MRKMLCVAVTSMEILFAGCNSPVFTPIASPNPWQDDYSFLSSMDNYRSWGTYNVHDPSCRSRASLRPKSSKKSFPPALFGTYSVSR